MRETQPLSQIDQPLHEERQDQSSQHRGEHATQCQDGGKAQQQDYRQHHRLFIGEVTVNPVTQNLEHYLFP